MEKHSAAALNLDFKRCLFMVLRINTASSSAFVPAELNCLHALMLSCPNEALFL